MRKYTTKIHVQRLKKMFERKDFEEKNLEMYCPAFWRFKTGTDYHFRSMKMWDLKNGKYPCDVCKGFVGLKIGDVDGSCPCHAFSGPKEARRVTEQKIKEYESTH